MRFEFTTAPKIVFGPDSIKDLPTYFPELGQRVLVVIGRSYQRAQAVFNLLTEHGIKYCTFQVVDEPTIEIIYEGYHIAREAHCSSVIGMGGGSVLDSGKVIAALLTNSGELTDYLEVTGKGHKLTTPPAYYVAIPTTAGTGTEVTYNAVIKSTKHSIKVSMRSTLMMPRLAIVDPIFTYSMPPDVTASTGLDALTQLMEVYVSNRANPITDGICLEGIKRAARSLPKAFKNGDDTDARQEMAIASLFGGMALANAKLGAVHGFAGVIGGMYDAPHGVICARLLPFVMETNISALKRRVPNSPILYRYKEISQILTHDTSSFMDDGIRWVHSLCDTLHIPPLGEFGIRLEDFPVIIENSQMASSMKGNPIELTNDELFEILQKAIT